MLDLLIAARAYRLAKLEMANLLRDSFPAGCVVAVVVVDRVVVGECLHVGDNPDRLAVSLPADMHPRWGRYYSTKIEHFRRIPGGLPSR